MAVIIDTVYVDTNGVPHTRLYSEKQKDMAKNDFAIIQKHPELPVRCRSRIDGKVFYTVKGQKYDFAKLALTLEAQFSGTFVGTYLLHEETDISDLIGSSWIVRTSRGKETLVLIKDILYRTVDQLDEQKAERNFSKHEFFENVVVRRVKTSTPISKALIPNGIELNNPDEYLPRG